MWCRRRRVRQRRLAAGLARHHRRTFSKALEGVYPVYSKDLNSKKGALSTQVLSSLGCVDLKSGDENESMALTV